LTINEESVDRIKPENTNNPYDDDDIGSDYDGKPSMKQLNNNTHSRSKLN
jgi:hypothetical protein